MRFSSFAVGLVFVSVAFGLTPPRPGEPPSVAALAGPGLSVTVAGNRLVDGSGATLRLAGVNRSGTEYACAQGWGIFDGPTDTEAIARMTDWKINAVRVPLNSACWLDLSAQLNPYDPAYTGARYRDAVVAYVKRLHAAGLYAILELHWNGCGTSPCLANWQKMMPDRPYARAFWDSVATTFSDDRAVLFDLFNEPHSVSWACWRDGGCTAYDGDNRFTVAGMQEMLDAVRAAGATQPVMLGGLSYANDLSGWLDFKPHDPAGQLVASVHFYEFNSPCNSTACLSSGPYSLMPVKDQHPVVFGELGEADNQDGFVNAAMPWADDHGFSYLGWTWNTWGCGGAVLIDSYDGTPCHPYGTAFKRHLAQLSSTPTTTATTRTTTTGPTTATTSATTTTTPSTTPPGAAAPPSGYWMIAADGAVHAFGAVPHLGRAVIPPLAEAVDIAPSPSAAGFVTLFR